MASGRAAAVIRFSSLGDILLAAHVPSFLKRVDPDRSLLFVTKERYAGLLQGHPHLERVLALGERPGDLERLIGTLREASPEMIYDLHRNLRSARVLSSLPDADHRLAPKHAWRRRLWVYARWLKPEPVPPLLRTYRALAGLPEDAELTPWLREALSNAERSRGLERAKGPGFVLLGVGARWGTKRWPARSFVELAKLLEQEQGVRAVFALEPGEVPEEGMAPPLQIPFRDLAAVASHALAIVSNDSAVLHLGPALGIPAVGIFGGTVPELGFARQGPRDEAVGVTIGCRPCSVHGRRRCPLGHHGCMRGLGPELVLRALRRTLDRVAA